MPASSGGDAINTGFEPLQKRKKKTYENKLFVNVFVCDYDGRSIIDISAPANVKRMAHEILHKFAFVGKKLFANTAFLCLSRL